MIELTAAIVMLVTNDVRKAVVVNSILAIVGPLIFIITMTVGIYQIAGQLSYAKLILIFTGVVLILRVFINKERLVIKSASHHTF